MFPRQAIPQRDRPDGRGHYYLFSHNVTGLNVSVHIEPARTCTTSDACRDARWQNRSHQLATAELLDCSDRNGFAWLEFTMKLQAAGRTAEQRHFSGHLVRDGGWVDIHLSMAPYTQADRQTFLDFMDAIRIEPKGLSSRPQGRIILGEES